MRMKESTSDVSLHKLSESKGPSDNAIQVLEDPDFPDDTGKFEVDNHRFVLERDVLDQNEVLGDVFDAFLKTNDMTWKNVPTIVNGMAGRQCKVFTHYKHCDIPYLATLWWVEGAAGFWLNIKLYTNGCIFLPRPFGGQQIQRHNHDKWLSIPSRQGFFFRLAQFRFSFFVWVCLRMCAVGKYHPFS